MLPLRSRDTPDSLQYSVIDAKANERMTTTAKTSCGKRQQPE